MLAVKRCDRILVPKLCYVVVCVSVAAMTGIGSVALACTGGRGSDTLVSVPGRIPVVAFVSIAAMAGVGGKALLGTGGRCHLFAICVIGFGGEGVLIRMLAKVADMRGVALAYAGRRCNNRVFLTKRSACVRSVVFANEGVFVAVEIRVGIVVTRCILIAVFI